MSYVKIVALVLPLFTVTAFVWASESDEIREKANAMPREEAERLQRDRPDPRKAETMEMKRLLEKLRLEEKELEDSDGKQERLEDVRREAEMIEDKLRFMSDESKHEHDGPHEDIARRLEHMQIAVEHLNQAGLHDIAEHVAERAEATERELHEQHRHHEGNVMHEVMKQLDELRHEVGRLRHEVSELKEQR